MGAVAVKIAAEVEMKGHTYGVDADGIVYVRQRKHWRIITQSGKIAAAVRHQIRTGNCRLIEVRK